MTHYIKIPGTWKAVNAAQGLIRAIGQKQEQIASVIAEAAKGEEIYIWGGGEYGYGGWNLADGKIQPTHEDTVLDLTCLFKDMETEAVLESLADNLTPKERYRVRITKATTSVGCQTFKNEDILSIADMVRKRI